MTRFTNHVMATEELLETAVKLKSGKIMTTYTSGISVCGRQLSTWTNLPGSNKLVLLCECLKAMGARVSHVSDSPRVPLNTLLTLA